MIDSSDPLLEQFLASNEVDCPDCGYGLFGLKSMNCPECGSAVQLCVTTGSRKFALWIAGIATSGFHLGFHSLILALFAIDWIQYGYWGGYWDQTWPLLAGASTSSALLALIIIFRVKFRNSTLPTQWIRLIIGNLVLTVFFAVFIYQSI